MNRKFSRRDRSRIWVLFFLLPIQAEVACTRPGYYSTNPIANPLAKSQIIDTVNVLVSAGNCNGALSAIQALYDSINTDNDVRMAMAGVYGCYSHINVLGIMDDMVTFGQSGALASASGPWEFFAREFASTSAPIDDKMPQAAGNGIDVLMATIKPGTIFISSYEINSATYNPGSLLVQDRLSDANAYLTFMGMALMGSLQSRYGVPKANYHKSTKLPFESATLTQGDGCGFASGILNFMDGLRYIQSAASAQVASKFSDINSQLLPGLATACELGCSDCGFSAGACNPSCANPTSPDLNNCTPCPITLRNRSSCTGVATDKNSCATAGIVKYLVNPSWNDP